ncbi:hypothetical protein QFC24_005488 [Naganishia onofrii]|uniref:Uncharacterized protein n=1 Tax=Naganishia onofrii TaxID=1851511 RepID=A0ACC2X8U4_9TREE|nr:hypothetical protein QFC24_005488 [Naganishia onofrii]
MKHHPAQVHSNYIDADGWQGGAPVEFWEPIGHQLAHIEAEMIIEGYDAGVEGAAMPDLDHQGHAAQAVPHVLIAVAMPPTSDILLDSQAAYDAEYPHPDSRANYIVVVGLSRMVNEQRAETIGNIVYQMQRIAEEHLDTHKCSSRTGSTSCWTRR